MLSFKKRVFSLFAVFILLLFPNRSFSQDTNTTRLAGEYFKDIEELCAKDGGHLWGKSLRVPFLFVDPGTREIYANRQNPAGILKPVDGIYYGYLPDNFGVANTSILWDGERWTTVMFPLPEDIHERSRLFMHESFHSIQEDIGLPAAATDNPHLETASGRIWMIMEWHALREALKRSGSERRRAVEDALLFRRHRQSLFPGSSESESRLVMHEGLAEYTGMKLCGLPDDGIIAKLVDKLEKHKETKSYINTFAYWSGPAYGILLDAAGYEWRPSLVKDDDLGQLAAAAYDIDLPRNIESASIERMAAYDGKQVEADELDREREIESLLAEYRRKLVDGPVLVLPFEKINISYDPRLIVSLGDDGKVYPTIRITDLWGVLTVTGGALIPPDWSKAVVSAPPSLSDSIVEGEGWQLELADDWMIVSGSRSGSYILERSR